MQRNLKCKNFVGMKKIKIFSHALLVCFEKKIIQLISGK